MFKEILYVGAGSFVGGALRHLVTKFMGGSFPWGTLVVNIAGCLLAGVLYGFFAKGNGPSTNIQLMLTTGICGGFTTFSAFANENLTLLRSGEILPFFLYATATILLGLAAVAIGYWIMKI